MDLWLRYGEEKVFFNLPDGWRLAKLALPAEEPKPAGIEEVKRELEKAFKGLGRLAKSGKAVIIVDDKTRPTPTWRLLPPLLNLLNEYGIADENVRIVVALGLHPKNTREELERKLGKETLERVKVSNHDPDRGLVSFGWTRLGTPLFFNREAAEADLKIGVGNISPHPAAGYSGGPKIVLPGIAGRETVLRNHSLFKSSEACLGRLEGNPVLADEVEAAERLGLNCLVNTVLDSAGRILKVFAGGFVEAYREGVSFFESLYRVRVPTVDVSIVSSHPSDIDLYQAWKAAFSASLVTREGGAIILVSPCLEGMNKKYYQILAGMKLYRLGLGELGRMVEAEGFPDPVFGWVYYKFRSMLGKRRLIVVTDGLSKTEVQAMGFEHAESVEEAIRMVRRGVKQAKVLVAPFGAKTLLTPQENQF